jgi:hypothetical protein
MKRFSSILTVVVFLMISPGISNAQLNVNKLKSAVKSNTAAPETKATPPAQKTEVAPATQTTQPTEAQPAAQAAFKIIFVSPSGNNKNDGSKETPMKNIDKAIEKAGPGDEIRIAQGTYMGTFNIGYLESDKPLKLYGSWDEKFDKQDIINHPTIFQPDNASGGKSRKALLRFTKDVAGTIVDGIIWDMGERNVYDIKDGVVEGVAGGRIKSATESSPGMNSTVEEPAISFLSATTGGDVTVQNCVFVNSANFAIQAGHRSGTFKIINNVFVASKMAAIEVYGTCAGSNQQKDMIACGDVEVAYNTILFTWSRLKDFLDMGYGVRIMTKCTYNIHNNIIGASIMGGIDNSRFCKDEYIKIDNNIMFGNKGGDLYYTAASNTKLNLTVDQFGDLEFKSVSGNIGKAPEIPVNQAYMKGFFSARYNETTSYDPNSAQNQWARALGMNQQGTMASKVTMFMNKYPWKESLKLFGASSDAGAQLPK